MAIDVARARQLLRNFDFKTLFIEELGWDRHQMQPLAIQVDGTTYTLQALVEKRGLVTFLCDPDPQGRIPAYATRRKLETQVAKSVHEHLIIYPDASRTTQTWQWVKREPGKPLACREHTYHRDQPGDALIQKLQALAIDLQEEEDLTIFDVTQKVRQGFYAEKVTKKFYDRFKTEHEAFLRFIQGIPDDEFQRWYASVMLNRLMFIYFIQKKGFLGGDQNYLRNKLMESRGQGRDLFYQKVLCPLFFEGFAKKPEDRDLDVNRLLGQVPYLNGGIFTRHQVEELHGQTISIPDSAFARIFDFFDAYHWHLDERPLRADNEINPDVLGYIFEKYINQKQMGAYYTKEDITGYIARNTIIPFLFGAAEKKCAIAFKPDGAVWRLLRDDPDRYIYEAVRRGVDLELPENIAAGIGEVSQRGDWNKPAAAGFALPTETWREHVARRQRCLEIREKLRNGEVHGINDLITYNLDICQFAEDVISNCEGPELLRAFYHAIEQVTVLDPTCGSGAFLFAALNILEPLYDACLDRMQVFVDELAVSGAKHHPEKFSDFKKILARVAEHPNHRYFVLKSIIINNLYGVDIMHEAVEICKLRLFLKLVAQVEDAARIEPLPDIDFNIRAGNTLVGFANYEEVKKAVGRKLDFDNAMGRIDEKAEECDRAAKMFRLMQTDHDMPASDFAAAKEELRRRLGVLADELDRYLAGEYGINQNNFPKQGEYEKRLKQWRASYQPFHWFSEFYGIIKQGGFNAIIGNPPYVEYSNVQEVYTLHSFRTESCGNLFAFTWERCLNIIRSKGRVGMIIPVSSVCTDGYVILQDLLRKTGSFTVSNFNDRPSKLFDGLEHSRLCIILHETEREKHDIFSSSYNKWQKDEREYLFENLSFSETNGFNIIKGAIPKVGSKIELSILKKMNANAKSLKEYTQTHGQFPIYYTRKLSHFVQILNFIPIILDKNGHKREPSELKKIIFPDNIIRNVFLSILNSSLFYWFITVYSDCRNLNKREVESIRFNLNNAKNNIINRLSTISDDLMIDIRNNSKMLTMNYKKLGTLQIQCTYPKYSKKIIDEIDHVLAQHYGFTDEELDFIINYDIKYRMGAEAEEGE